MTTAQIVLLDIKKKKSKKAGPVTHKNVLVRMEIEVIDQLKSMAKAQTRSLTGEIVRRLKESLRGESIDEHGVIVRHVPSLAK